MISQAWSIDKPRSPPATVGGGSSTSALGAGVDAADLPGPGSRPIRSTRRAVASRSRGLRRIASMFDAAGLRRVRVTEGHAAPATDPRAPRLRRPTRSARQRAVSDSMTTTQELDVRLPMAGTYMPTNWCPRRRRRSGRSGITGRRTLHPPLPLLDHADSLGIRWLGYDRPGYGGSTSPRPRRAAAGMARPSPMRRRGSVRGHGPLGQLAGRTGKRAAPTSGERWWPCRRWRRSVPTVWTGSLAWRHGEGRCVSRRCGRAAKERYEASNRDDGSGFTAADHAAREPSGHGSDRSSGPRSRMVRRTDRRRTRVCPSVGL